MAASFWVKETNVHICGDDRDGQHQPLNRQAERYAREGDELSLSTLADQVGARERCDEVEGAAPRVGEGLGERLLHLLLGSGAPGRRHCAQA